MPPAAVKARNERRDSGRDAAFSRSGTAPRRGDHLGSRWSKYSATRCRGSRSGQVVVGELEVEMLRFTLRRDPYGRLSACADGPSGRDVDCRVHVRVRLMSAGYAPEDRLALTVVRCAVPADAAGLRRVRRLIFSTRPGGLVLQAPDEQSPAVGQDAPVESGFGAATVRQVRSLVVRGRVWVWGAWSSGRSAGPRRG